MERALRCARFLPSGVPQKRRKKSCSCVLCLPCQSGSGSQELDGRTLPGCGTPSTLVPSSSPRPRQMGTCALCLAETLPADVDHPESQEVFDYKLEACLQCGRGCGPWGRVCPFPLPVPPASGRAGPVHCRLALPCTCSDPLFCKRPAVCSGWLIFCLSFAVPQFKLVTHKSSL